MGTNNGGAGRRVAGGGGGGGAPATGMRIIGAGGVNLGTRGFNPTIPQRQRQAAARAEARNTPGAVGYQRTTVEGPNAPIGRVVRTGIRVSGAGGVRPTQVGQYDFRIGNNTMGFTRQPYRTARRAAIAEARSQGVGQIRLVRSRA